MSRIAVVTDSTAEVTREEAEALGITVVPLDTIVDGTSYRDGGAVSDEAFLSLMEASGAAPMTSLPSVGAFHQAYERLGKDGFRVISIHLTGELSGTYGSARLAGQLSSADVTVVDSRFIARAHAFQVLQAARLAATGSAEVEEIVAELDRVRSGTVQYLGVTDLGQLVRGGRVTRIQGVLSNLLKVRILLRMEDGNLVLDASSVGMAAYERRLHRVLDRIGADAGRVEEVGISHTGIQAYTQRLIDRTRELFGGVPLYVGYASDSIASHAGVGAVSLQVRMRPEAVAGPAG